MLIFYIFSNCHLGALAAWYRLKYPHLVNGAVSSSAPVFAKLNFFGKLLFTTNFNSFYLYNLPSVIFDIIFGTTIANNALMTALSTQNNNPSDSVVPV